MAATGIACWVVIMLATGASSVTGSIGSAASGSCGLVVVVPVEQTSSYFGPPAAPGEAPDGAALRDIVPGNPRRAYDVRKVIRGITDRDSVLKLKAGYGRAMVTALMRIEGRAVGVIANQPMFLAGAIDGPAADKAARFV